MKPSATRYLLLSALLLALLVGTRGHAEAAPPVQDDADCEALGQEGVIFYNQAQYPQALRKLQDALVCYRGTGDRAEESTVLNGIGFVYARLGQYDQALDHYQQALSIQREINDRAGEGTSLNNIGGAYYTLGQYEQALDYYQQAISIRQEVGDRRGVGETLNNIGGIYHSWGQYNQALDYFQQALTIWQEIGDAAGEGGALSNIGIIYSSWGQYEEALEYFQQALSVQQEIGDIAGTGATFNNIGSIYDDLDQNDEALDYYQQALSIQRQIGDRAAEGIILSNIGSIYEDLGQYVEALDCYRQALSIQQEIGGRAAEGAILNNIGTIYDNVGQCDKALNYYQQALSIHRDIGDRAGEGMSLNNIGFVYAHLGRYDEALDHYRQALSIQQEIADRATEGVTLSNIGAIYEILGRYEEALSCYQQALSIQQEIGSRAEESTTLNNIGLVYARVGQYETALDYYHQALSIQQGIADRAGEGVTLNNIGAIYRELEQYEDALDLHQHALNTLQEIGDRAGEGTSLSNIGAIYDSLGQYEKALDYYRRALSVLQETGDRPGEGAALNNIGAIYHNLGQYEEALGYYQQALSVLQETGDPAWESQVLSGIGGVYDSLGEYEEALDYYRQAIVVIEAMRGELTVEEFKSSFGAEQVYAYDYAVSLLVQIGYPDEAFDYVQRAKSRTFLDQLANVRADPRATDAPELLAREQELLGEIRALEDILSGRGDISSSGNTTDGSQPPLTGDQRNEVQARLEAAYREYEQLLTRIKLTNPQYASLRSVQASTLITVQQTLPPGVTLLEYYVALDQTFAFVVTQDDLHVVSISVTPQDLSESITWLRSFPSLEGVPQASGELYDLLFAPIREHIHTDALYIAPHGVLHYLPFGALHDGERYVVEDYAIAYLPSASVLQYVLENVHDDAEGDLMALCNPEAEGALYLNYAIAETEVIAALFNIQPILGPDATETRLWEQSPHASLVHIAAHGQFNPFAPQFSRIYLAPDDENDGYLEVREVFNLRLDQADLVTLSACETQLGKLSAGDELVGLSRAFIYAGTPSLAATLWSVDDASTRFLMERFYGYLKEGQGKAVALRQAQLDTMEEYPSPYHWAPFTLIGEMGEVEEVGEAEPTAMPDRIWLWIGGVALLLVLIGGGVWIWRQRV